MGWTLRLRSEKTPCVYFVRIYGSFMQTAKFLRESEPPEVKPTGSGSPYSGYKTVSITILSEERTWKEGTRESIRDTLKDPIISKLLHRSNLTTAQFETLLIDQLGNDIANKKLTRNEMAQLMRNQNGISRGALNRTLRQARQNVSEAIHTVLLLGYGGMIESPSLAPFVEASERLRSQISHLKELSPRNETVYRSAIEALLNSLEDAFHAIYARNRDV